MHGLTFQILVALLSDPADGNAILERLEKIGTDSTPSLPTLYRALRSALDEGWVEVAGKKDDGGPGRPRQIYAITSEGAQAVREEARRLRALAAHALQEGLTGEGDSR